MLSDVVLRFFKFIGWILLGIFIVAVVILLLPIILVVLLIALIFGMFGRGTFRTWTVRVQDNVRGNVQHGAQTIKEKVNEHKPASLSSGSPRAQERKIGARKSTVVDADVKEF